jgi:uncharacterized protein (DUF58 family)
VAPADADVVESSWTRTRALGRALAAAGVLLFVAVLLQRTDLVVLATPFAVGTALSLYRRPVATPTIRLAATSLELTEGADTEISLGLHNPDRVRYDVVVARLAAATTLHIRDADRPHATTLPAGGSASLRLSAQAARWGRPSVGPAVVHAIAAGGLLVSPAAVAPYGRLKVYPATEDFSASDAMPRASGLSGSHHSRKMGEGGELAGVRVFSPGDRLRRIDWRVSLRTRQLHVAATLSDRDAEVVLLLDVLHEAGHSGGIFGARSVLDTTVRAAAGIAEHYLKRGDRVGMVEYGFRARRLRTLAGRRHYLMALEWLLDVDPAGTGFEPSARAFGAHLIPPNALIIVLTPLLDERAAEMIAMLARAGRFVVAVDTLPADLRLASHGAWNAAAERLWRLDRDNTVGALREHGVAVVPWAGARSLDEVLRLVARQATGPKVAQR